jgi:hypothetical protein
MRLALLAVLLGGCATAPLRARGQWREVATDHFRLATDVDAAAAQREAVRLETALASLGALAAPSRPLPARVDVLWLRDEDDVERLGMSSATTGYFLPHQPGEPASPPLVVVGGRPGRRVEARFMHELAHALLVDSAPQAPPWLAEGLAAYYGTLRVDEGTIGYDPDEPAKLAFNGNSERAAPSLERVLGSDEALYHHDFFGPLWYRAARTFIAMLQATPMLRERFADYLLRLNQGQSAAIAWVKTLGDLPREDLVREYQHFLATRPTAVKLAPWHGTPALAQLPLPAVERWLARARPWDSREALVAAGAGLARASGDDSAERHYWSGVYAARWHRWREAEAELRAALARAPDFAPASAALANVMRH